MKSAVILAILATGLLQARASAGTGASADLVSPETRLLGAMKLWGDIKLFDPQVSQIGVDWDGAFTTAEPAILNATSRESYAAAIGRLLFPLADPATHVDVDSSPSAARVAVTQVGSASVITVEHGTSETVAMLRADEVQAVERASKSREIVFDLRDVTEANDADASTLQSFFSSDSPIRTLLDGNIALPRERSRFYVGYPDESGAGYSDYSAQDSLSDTVNIEGKSYTVHRYGFLVNGSTSLPSMAVALAVKGEAAIYTVGGQPTALSPGTARIELPYGVTATYRIGDLADIASQQQFASASVGGVGDVIAELRSKSLATPVFASPPPASFGNQTYANQLFPAAPMRLLAVARIYNVIRYFSPYRALMRDNWDAAAQAAIGDELAATNARLYLLGLMRFYAHLHDSHGDVGGNLVEAEFGAGPPFQARYLHGQAVVTDVLTNGAALHGMRVGDVIDAADGVPIRQVMDRIEGYICASTSQRANYEALSTSGEPSAFTGKLGTAISLRFHHPGQQSSVTSAYVRGSFNPKPRAGPKYTILPGNIGYVDFDRLKPSEVDSMFDALKNTRAIVFDNRGYPLGAAWKIAPRLTMATSVRLALFNTPFVVEPLDVQFGEIVPLPTYQQFYQMLDRADGPRYLKPTVMLVDERTISQSEHSALFFREAGHTRFVGTPTAGANGDVTSMVAPGNIVLYFSGEGVRYAGGSQLQRVGIIPDVRVEPTAFDVATGNDVVLQRGLKEALRLSRAGPEISKAALRQEIARERMAGDQAQL